MNPKPETLKQSGNTPLHAAAVGGHDNVVGTLLAAGADMEAKENWVHPYFLNP
jgi:ankyrin repeat protein